ncbi:MAG TPA: class I SAM-dependent methyltransferase [Planctomycetota bacterium]|jgi:ubiquinone/menaquinone biosynthesis C-methylase UbiE
MSGAPPENAHAFWDAFAAAQNSECSAVEASLALYESCPIYNAYRDRSECIAIQSLIPRLSPDWRVLDVGCGVGRWTLPLAQACKEVVAIDFSEQMLHHARRRCEAACVGSKCQFKQGRLEELDPQAMGKPFDLVLVVGVLHYLPETALPNVIARISACVAPRGLLLHREKRARRMLETQHTDPNNKTAMRSFYKPFDTYRAAFSEHGMQLIDKRSIIPPSVAYSVYSRLFPPGKVPAPLGGVPLRALLWAHERIIDPLWRVTPGLLWWVNSRRATDQVAVLYRKK